MHLKLLVTSAVVGEQNRRLEVDVETVEQLAQV
jgi:hypothetical protein